MEVRKNATKIKVEEDDEPVAIYVGPGSARFQGISVPNPYVSRKFKPIRPYLTAPTIVKRKKQCGTSVALSPSPHTSASAEFRFYEGKGPYQGHALLTENDLAFIPSRHFSSKPLPKGRKKSIAKQEHPSPKKGQNQDVKKLSAANSKSVGFATQGLNIYGLSCPTEGRSDNKLDLQASIQSPQCRTLSSSPSIYPSEKSRLTILYSYPQHGSTSVAAHLLESISEHYQTRWVSYIDLRRASKILEKSPRNSWTLSKLIISYFEITDQSEILRVHRLFFDTERDRMRDDDNKRRAKVNKRTSSSEEFSIEADVFLDEIDEMQPESLETMLLILRKVNWNKSSARVWVTARTHMKSKIDETVISYLSRGENWVDETVDCYEMLPLSSDEQIAFLYRYWKTSNFSGQEKESSRGDITELEPDDYEPFWQRLKVFVQNLYYQLEGEIPNFYKTIGACPFHLSIVATHFTGELVRYFENADTHYKYLNIPLTRFFDEFIQSKFDHFFKNQLVWQSKVKKETEIKETMFRKISRLHLKLGLSSYDNNFATDSRQVRQILGSLMDDEHELYLMGLVYEINGETKFLHEMLAEFLIAQYYVDFGRQKNTGVLYISFFFNNVLFDDKCQRVRKYFDDYMSLQRERKKIKGNIIWQRLRQFLIQHYLLDDDDEGVEDEVVGNSGTNKGNSKKVKKPEAAGSSEAPPPNGEKEKELLRYKHVRKNGSVLHLAIVEGNMRIALLLTDSFKGSPKYLRKFLNISVLLQFVQTWSQNSNVNKRVMPGLLSDQKQVSTLQLLALFGKDAELLDKMVQMVLATLSTQEIQASLRNQSWTALHFAAMNSNWEFLHSLFSASRRKGKVTPNLLSPIGSTPLQMVLLSNSWFYTVEIIDHPHPKTIGICATSLTHPVVDLDSDEFECASPPPPKKHKLSTIQTLSNQIYLEDARQCSHTLLKHQGVIKRFYSINYYVDDFLNNPCIRHISTINVLLENGASLNSELHYSKFTLLHQASILESGPMVNYLLEKGANPDAKDRQGKTPSFYQEFALQTPLPIPGILDIPPPEGVEGEGTKKEEIHQSTF